MTTRPQLLKLRRDNNQDGKKINGQDYLSFPTKPMPHGLLLQFKDYNYNSYVNTINAEKTKEGTVTAAANENLSFVDTLSVKAVAEIEANAAIELPFPRTLTDSTNIRVQQFERDFLYERVAGAISGLTDVGADGITQAAKQVLGNAREYGQNVIDDPMKTARDIVSKFQGAVGNSPQKAAAMAAYLGRNFISGEISKNMGVVSERVVNPQETLSFTGVDLRNFSFTWDLFPSNKNDTENLNKIIRFLKMKSLPAVEGVDGSPTLARAFLKYPSIVELNLLGVQEDHFMRFKRCMISNVTVDYGAGGMPEIIKGGVPAAISLTISFSEIVMQTKDDYIVKGQVKGESDA